MTRLPSPPPGLGVAGKHHWKAVLLDYELSGADLLILREICEIADMIDRLRPMLRVGLLMKGPDDQPRTNPALVQYRLLTMQKARLCAALRVIGDTSEDEHDRPQRRVGIKGTYQPSLKAVK